jgi:hypothetical protein
VGRSRCCSPGRGDAGQFAEGVGEALGPEVNLKSIRTDIHPRDQKLDNAGLFLRE